MRRNAEIEFMKLLRNRRHRSGDCVSFLKDAANDPSLNPDVRRYAKVCAVTEETDGGPGSGNWGHKGRPGYVGGSGKGGGSQYRGGRGDIGYFSSKRDWLNGLKGENQHKASQFLKECG